MAKDEYDFLDDLERTKTSNPMYEIGYKKGRADAIDECINYLNDYFGVAEAKKYGNKTREQQEISYKSWMNYEIKEGIEELEGLKGEDINVPTTNEGEQNV